MKKPEQSFECPDGQGIIQMKSKFIKEQLDRIWDFKCSRIADTFNKGCYWIAGDDGYINEPDHELQSSTCNEGYVMAGIKSFYEELNNDRKWNIKCCKNTYAIVNECATTRIINQFQQDIDYEVNINYVFTGLQSRHDNYYE